MAILFKVQNQIPPASLQENYRLGQFTVGEFSNTILTSY